MIPPILHREIDGVEVKRCAACHAWLPLATYSKGITKWDGLNSYCSECRQAQRAKRSDKRRDYERAYRRANAEKERIRHQVYNASHAEQERERQRAYRLEHPEMARARKARWIAVDENRERENARKREWYAAHSETCKRRDREYRAAHPEKAAEQAFMWRLQNQEHVKAYRERYAQSHKELRCAIQARRKARQLGAPGADYTSAGHIQARAELWGDRCYICGAPAEAIDHVIPLAKGGGHWPANLRPICTHCNSVKKDKWPYAPALAAIFEAMRM